MIQKVVILTQSLNTVDVTLGVGVDLSDLPSRENIESVSVQFHAVANDTGETFLVGLQLATSGWYTSETITTIDSNVYVRRYDITRPLLASPGIVLARLDNENNTLVSGSITVVCVLKNTGEQILIDTTEEASVADSFEYQSLYGV